MLRMSAGDKVQVSWLVNVVMVPVCAYFLYQHAESNKRVEASQIVHGNRLERVETKVNDLEKDVDRILDSPWGKRHFEEE